VYRVTEGFIVRSILLTTALLALAPAAHAVPSQWGGNGHYYEFVSGSFTWTQARDAAAASTHLGFTGYLATITSGGEQNFLDALWPGDAAYWLGGSDAAVEGQWEWVTEPGGPIAFTYTNWRPGEPNDQNGEDYLHGWFATAAQNATDPNWNDIPIGQSYGYVVEYSAAPIPLPAGLPLLLTGAAGLALLRRRRQRAG